MTHQKMEVVDSSNKDADVSAHRMYAVSYFTSWQIVRISLNFSEEAIRPTMARLRVYYKQASTTEEAQYRLFRIRNLLNAIPFGQTTLAGIRVFNDSRKEVILAEREYYTQQKSVIGYPVFWDWSWTREDLKTLTPESIFAVYENIIYRLSRREPKLELEYYITLLENI